MALLVGAFFLSLLPSIGLFLWLRGLEGDEVFAGICNRALIQGFLVVFPVFGCSLVLALLQRGLESLGLQGVGAACYRAFFVFAFSEELMKYLWFRKTLKKFDRAWSWMDYIILMTIVGIGFGLIEDIPYGFMTNAGQMLVRGLTIMHGSYGFIMGYFMGKAEKTGDKKWQIIGFCLPWIMHGLYDFCLSDALLAVNDDFGLISLALAALAVITIIFLIVFMNKKKDDPVYREPMQLA